MTVGTFYTADYPNKIYIYFNAEDPVGGEFNFWSWYQPGVVPVPPETPTTPTTPTTPNTP